MDVILVKPVRKLGQIGKIFEVSNGYARNYLFPNKLAIRATEDNKKLIEKQKHDLEVKDAEEKKHLETVNTAINDKELFFIRQSADDGRLFGSIGSKEIAENLSKIALCSVPRLSVLLDKPIKTRGVFSVEIKLHPELSSVVTVIIARSESEAQDYIREHRQAALSSSSINQGE